MNRALLYRYLETRFSEAGLSPEQIQLHTQYYREKFDAMTDRSERVAAFLAVLELTKSGRILLNEDNSMITFNKENYREDDMGDIENMEITSE